MSAALRPELLARLTALTPAAPASDLARAVRAGGPGGVFFGRLGAAAIDDGRSEKCSGPGMWSDDGAAEERAAILEHDGGWPRRQAEALARRAAAMAARGAGPAEWAVLDAELIDRERR